MLGDIKICSMYSDIEGAWRPETEYLEKCRPKVTVMT
jgi:hypothetical protein